MIGRLTFLPGEGWRRLQFRGLGQMQPAGEVEADPLGLSAGPAEDGSSVVLHPLSCLVEERVLGVVLHAVEDDEVEVGLELLQAPVVVAVDAFPHGGEVHRVLDVVQVVRNLQEIYRESLQTQSTFIMKTEPLALLTIVFWLFFNQPP